MKTLKRPARPRARASLPAILGGSPAVTLPQEEANRWPLLGREDEEAVLRVLREGDISTHRVIRELEEDYRVRFDAPYALAHCNGTAALLAAFWAIGLKPGDEVLVPSATFWASVLPLVWLGAVPVFCESEGERLGLDPEDLERRVTPRTRAIVVTHLWGLPSRMSGIGEVARRHGLRIVEDASHAQGASWRGRPCGTLGDVGVMSLQGGKLAPAGEGGMLLCRDRALWERAVCLGDITRIIELDSPARRFAATSFGVKTRIAPLSAAIGRAQLARMDERNRMRGENVGYLSARLERLGVHTFRAPEHARRVYFEWLVRPDLERIGLSLDELIRALRAEGVAAARPRYPLLHRQPFFTEGAFREVMRPAADAVLPEYAAVRLPRTEALNEGLLRLPSFPRASRALLDQVALAFERVARAAPRIAARLREGAP